MNYFSKLQKVAVEKAHSAAIAWLLSDDNESFSQKEKVTFLEKISWKKISDGETIQKTSTEYSVGKKFIDILIETENYLFGIENKIKIGQHDDQLKVYHEALNNKGKKLILIYLTFGLNDLTDEEKELGWIYCPYEKLHHVLKEALEKAEKNKDDFYFVKDYSDCVKRLCTIKEKFLKNHTDYKWVFDKKNDTKNNDEEYIKEIKIETLLQRLLLEKIHNDIKIEAERIEISETHGNALLDIKKPRECPSIDFNNISFETGIQFQNNSIKIQIEKHLDKQDKNIKELKLALESFVEQIEIIFTGKTYRSNKAKSENSIFHSFSKKIADISITNFDDLVKEYSSAITDGIEILKNIKKSIVEK